MKTASLYTVMSAVVAASACAIQSNDESPQDVRHTTSAAETARDSAVAAFAEQLREADHAVLTVHVTRTWTREGDDAPFEVDCAVARSAMSRDAAAIEVWASSADSVDTARAAIDISEPAHFTFVMDGRCVLERATRPEPFEQCYDARVIYLQAIGREQIDEQEARQAWQPYRNSIPQPVLMPFDVGCMVAASSLGTMIGDESALRDAFEDFMSAGQPTIKQNLQEITVRHLIHSFVLKRNRLVSWRTTRAGGERIIVEQLHEYDWKIGSGEAQLTDTLNELHGTCDCEHTIATPSPTRDAARNVGIVASDSSAEV